MLRRLLRPQLLLLLLLRLLLLLLRRQPLGDEGAGRLTAALAPQLLRQLRVLLLLLPCLLRASNIMPTLSLVLTVRSLLRALQQRTRLQLETCSAASGR